MRMTRTWSTALKTRATPRRPPASSPSCWPRTTDISPRTERGSAFYSAGSFLPKTKTAFELLARSVRDEQRINFFRQLRLVNRGEPIKASQEPVIRHTDEIGADACRSRIGGHHHELTVSPRIRHQQRLELAL